MCKKLVYLLSLLLVLALAGSAGAAVPPPFFNQDIGTNHGTVTGSADYDSASGTLTILGDGEDIWGGTDDFHYVYQEWTGDCEIIVRVTAIEQTNAWVKAGLMIRAALTDTANHATMVVTPPGGTNQFSFQWVDDHEDMRNNTSTGGGPLTLPEWVRLVRSGNDFIGYWAHDSAGAPALPWTQLNSQIIYMTDPVYIGVCVTSHNVGTLSTCTFDNLGGDFVMDANSAWGPTPADGAFGVPVDANLYWSKGWTADTHQVYFGTTTSPPYVTDLPVGTEVYDPPGDLAYYTTYYWRIDEVNGITVYPGPEWSFTTRPDAPDWTLYGHWEFDGDATDSSGYGHHGTEMGDAGYVGGIFGQAIDLDGNGDYVNIDGYKGVLGTNPFTVSAWIKKTNTEDSSIVCWGTDAGGQRADFRINNIRLRMEHGNGNIEGVTANVITDGEWHHVAVTAIENARIRPPDVTLYLDGQDDTNPGGTDNDRFNIVANTDVSIGRRPTQNDRYFNGMVDDVRLYSRTLSPAEVKDLAWLPWATEPDPEEGEFVDPCEFVLCTWTPGKNAAEHDVYFGTDPNTLTGPYTRGEPNFVPPGGLEFATTYYWQVDEVNEGHPDSPWVGSLWSFTTIREPGMGSVIQELYGFDTPGVDIADLYNDPNFPDNPAETSLRPMFEGPTSGTDTYSNYGGRLHGWLMPEISGDYTFYVASDDASEFWLSPDEVPHHAELIAYELGVTGWRNWQTGDTRESAPISLVAGEKYYICGLWKEGGGGDYLAVAWQGGPGSDQPDAPVGGSADQIIAGYYLWPFVQMWAHKPNPADEALRDVDAFSAPPYNLYVEMDFKPGVDANTHEGFFSDDEAKVTARDPSVSLGAPPLPLYYPLRFYAGVPLDGFGPYTDSLVQGTTYYWCVDETDTQSQLWQGPVWSFTTLCAEAWDPEPYDFEDLISVTPVLRWERGAQKGYATPHEHDIYFGTNEAAVNDANTTITLGVFMGTQTASSPGTPGDETWEPNSDGGLPPLERVTNYYWRIDETHGRYPPFLPGAIITGDVWTFKTRPDIGIADINEVGWWRFDRGYGLKAIDSSGHDRYGSLIGDPDGPTWVEQGKLNGALYFDSDNEDYVNIDGYKGILGGNPFTIAAWIKTRTNNISIVTWGTNAGGQRVGFRVDGVIRMEHGNGNVRGTSGPDLRDGEWHHVAATVQTNCAIEDVNLYVDGIDVTEVKTDVDQFNIVAGTDVSIGRRATHNDQYFNGIIDNVRIYDRELSAEEIPGTMRSDPGIAYNPDPENWADVHVGDVNLLTWSPGDGAGTHNVYFGTNPAALGGPIIRPLAEPNYDPGALQLGTTYYWRVDEVNGTVQTGDIWRFNVMSGSRGLVGDYYNFTGPTPPSREATFAGPRVLTRIDPTIDFDWGDANSPPGTNLDLFSIRWSGAIQPDEDGLYTFLTRTDDGLRLWVDDELIIENWTNHGSTWDTNEIELTAGETYTIVMEYYENTGGADVQLWWQTPSMPMRQIVPERVLAQPLWAYNPYPADGARLVDPAEITACTWTSGASAAWHEVYWGTDPNALTYRVTKPRGDETFLPTEGIGFAETYYWRVDEVNGTEVWTGDIWTFKTVRAAGLGSITAEIWLGITGGDDLDLLKNHPAYLADQPNDTYEIITFDTGAGLADNYGGRVHGWLVPETSGLYNFWLTTDDQGELYLSENYPPGPDDLIAFVKNEPHATSGTGWAGPYTWDKYPEQDSNNVVGLIWLNADQPYYICALWKEGGGGDHCMVAWYGPDSPDVNILPVNGSADAIIDGWYLMPFERFWASNPNPYHTQELSADDVTLLTWTPGIDANTHDVYFGTSPSDVETGATPVISGLALDVNYYDPVFEGDITEWEWETTYYWRIDEVNLAEEEEWTGRIWTFKTTNYAVLEDFEPYLSTDTGTDPNALRYVWKDGYSFWQPPPVKSKSGSNIMIAGPDDPPKPYLHYDNDYHDGAQGLALYYDNDGNTIRLGWPDANIYPVHKYSEIEATTGSLGLDPNWTRQDIKALSLWFKGNPTGLKGSFELTYGTDGYVEYGPFDATLIAAGTDIEAVGPPGGAYHDEFHYAYKELAVEGPPLAYGSIEVRVDDVNNTNSWAKAGLMMRETLHVDSNFVMVVVTPGQGVSLQYRNEKSGTVTNVTQQNDADGNLITAPHWLKLERDENGFFIAYHANDTEYPNWKYINDIEADSTAPVDMDPVQVYAGLCLTSHNAAQLCKAEFSSILFAANPVYPPSGSYFVKFWDSRDIGIISNDPEPMYLALEDTLHNVGVKYYTDPNGHFDPNAALITDWTEWNIDLADGNFASVDMRFVDTVYIGFGDRVNKPLGGSGVVYFDDIRLNRSRFIPGYLPLMLPGNIWRDPDGDPDGVVDWKDLMIMGRDWLLTDSFVELLVQWKFDDGTGLVAADSSGYGHDGAITGAGWYNLDPDPNRAMCLEFLGAAADVNDDDADLYLNGLDSMTVSIWVKSDVIGTDAGFIIFEDPTGSDSRGIRYDAAGANGGEPNVIKIGITSTGGEQQLESSAEVQTTEWQHLAVTWSSGNQLALYINGVLDTPSANSAATTGTTTGATKLLVGKGGKFDDTATGWNGLIDEVRIYDHALPAVEIANLALNAEPSSLYIPVGADEAPWVPSPANIYDHPVIEPEGLRSVNFRDFAVLANDWLEEELKFPQ